ncbi:hypothetical protein BX666DRAFT_577133 [Dichotomocladium elegans]|nr:hypothetical protein BX666DRAFT_577133 [Dichotomocladium elegans]
MENATLVSSPTNVWTLHDVILDSPVWKSNLAHLEEQIDHFEKWVEGFTRALKQFVDAVIKYNTQTGHLCKKILPQNMDGSLIDPQVAGMIINTFASTLQCHLAFKTKMVSDLQDNLLHPLQQFIKHELKEIKEARRVYERISDRYDAQIQRYSALSKTKEASALREDAFQTYDVRKSYARTSKEYFLQIVAFKANLEHILVECFTSAMVAHVEEVDQATQSSSQSRAMLSGWQQWLEESKATCEYQLGKITEASQVLENSVIQKMRPHRSLRTYSSPSNSELPPPPPPVATPPVPDHAAGASSLSIPKDNTTPSPELSSSPLSRVNSSTSQCDGNSKEGYLITRTVVGKPARYSWIRRWFFVQNGWFGSCIVTTVDKNKGCITIAGDRIAVASCSCRIVNDIDRRFCFEVRSNKTDSSILVQAETEEEMQLWIRSVEEHKAFQQQRQHELGNDDHGPQSVNFYSTPGPLLAPRSILDIRSASSSPLTVMTNSPLLTALSSTPANETVSLSTPSSASQIIALMIERAPPSTSLSVDPLPVPQQQANQNEQSSASPACSISTDGVRLDAPVPPEMARSGSSNATVSSSPQLENDIIPPQSTSPAPASTWGMPWIKSGFGALANSGNGTDVGSNYVDMHASKNEPNLIFVWPTQFEMNARRVELNGYTDELKSRQRELRSLFLGVQNDEIVIEAFSASLYRKTATIGMNKDDTESEYGYSGRCYVTQNRLWFYSTTLNTNVNTVVIPLEDIKSIRLEKALSGASLGMLMFVETRNDTAKSFCFGIWLEPAEIVGERLRFAVENVKSDNDTDVQGLFDQLRAITLGRSKGRTPFSHVTPVSAPNAALTPVTVQAHPSPSPSPRPPSRPSHTGAQVLAPSASEGSEVDDSEPKGEVAGSGSSSNGGGGPRLSIAASALTAAMEAATTSSSPSAYSQRETRSVPSPSLPDVTQDVNDEPNKPMPNDPVNCECADHLDKLVAKVIVPTNARVLFRYMFSDDESGPAAGKHGLWAKLNSAKHNGAPVISCWVRNSEHMKERTLTYIMPISNPLVKAKDTEVNETQQIQCENESRCYTILTCTRTPNLPYADAFISCIKYCITHVSQNTCQLTCHIGVRWIKSIMAKGMVSRAAMKGMNDTIDALIPIIQHDLRSQSQQKEKFKRESDRQKRDGQAHPPSSGADAAHDALSIRTLLSMHSLVYGIIAAVLFFTVCLYSSGWRGFMCTPNASLYSNDTTIPGGGPGGNLTGLPSSSSSSSTSNNQIIYRAVFLRDLEEGLASDLNVALKHVNPRLYKSFEAERGRSSAGCKHTWFNARHQLMGAELKYTRERLGALRYEVLTTFRLLNAMDERILENEYWNWLLDERLRCDKALNDDQYQAEGHCADVLKEVDIGWLDS